MENNVIFQSKTLSQEIIAVFDKSDTLKNIYVQRENMLNLGEVITAKITAFNKTLRGYFALTKKNLNIFIPTNNKFTLGESVLVRVKKEARFLKDATGEITTDEETRPSLLDMVKEKHSGKINTSHRNLFPYIEKALEKQITFSDGADILIERTNAICSIDIDTGKSTQSFFEINKQAIPLIQKQIELKNIAGMIVIDFAGFKSFKEKEILLKEIKQAFKNDSKTKIYGFSKLNLLEIKRERTSACLFDLFYTPNGKKTPDYICFIIEESLKTIRGGKPILTVHPALLPYLNEDIKQKVTLKTNLNVDIDFFDIKEK